MSEHENYRRLKELQMIRDEERELLRKMLDQYMDSRDWIPVMQSAMGQGSSYIASVTLDWLATRVRFAHELPIFKEKHDPKTKKITIDQETIEMVRQRPIDHSRQFPMAQYLLLREHHKFPPVLAVLSSDWVDNPNSDNWTHDRAVTSVVEFQSLAGNGAIGLLRLSDKDTLYVLDGQHRLLAVKGALSLLQTGVLEELKPDGTSRENRITKEEIIQSQGVPESKLQHLRKEQIGVEIIPAVFQGEKYDEARRRVRRVFVHVNRLAAQLDKGTMSTLDEDNGFRIIAREIATVHPLFKGRVNFEKPNLTATSIHLSTLESLANGLKSYLEGRIPYRDWIPKLKNLVPERPDPEQLHEGVDEAKIFFDHFKELPIMRRVIQGEQLVQLREFKKGRRAQAHVDETNCPTSCHGSNWFLCV